MFAVGDVAEEIGGVVEPENIARCEVHDYGGVELVCLDWSTVVRRRVENR